MGDGEDHVVVGNGKKFFDPFFDPELFGGVLTFRTISVSAGVVGGFLMQTELIVAGVDVPAELGSSAGGNGADHTIFVMSPWA
jgi:hypothetical protein